jgi:hypothetical protein
MRTKVETDSEEAEKRVRDRANTTLCSTTRSGLDM